MEAIHKAKLMEKLWKIIFSILRNFYLFVFKFHRFNKFSCVSLWLTPDLIYCESVNYCWWIKHFLPLGGASFARVSVFEIINPAEESWRIMSDSRGEAAGVRCEVWGKFKIKSPPFVILLIYYKSSSSKYDSTIRVSFLRSSSVFLDKLIWSFGFLNSFKFDSFHNTWFIKKETW